jgi:cytochrome P450
MPVREGFYAVTRYDDIVHVSRSPDLFSSELGGTNLWDPEPAQLDALRNFMLNMDPPKHAKYRRIVSRTFTPRAVQQIEPAIRRHARRIVDEIARHGECDFVTGLACELPLVLICEFLGFPQEDRHRVFDWSNRADSTIPVPRRTCGTRSGATGYLPRESRRAEAPGPLNAGEQAREQHVDGE